MTRRFAFGLCVLAILIVGATTSMASSTAARLEGTVRNQDGTTAAGVSVTATSQNTGLTRSTESDENGIYRFIALPPGTYMVEPYRREESTAPRQVRLLVGRTTSLDLEMGTDVAGEVRLDLDGSRVDSTSSEVSTFVSYEQLQLLPTLNRDPVDLANLAPGARTKQTGNKPRAKDQDLYSQFTVGAGNARQMGMNVDGGSNADDMFGYYATGIGMDAVDSFELVTHQYSAEFGRASQGMLNVLTKSGTNELDGTLFLQFRNDSFRSEDFSEKVAAEALGESPKKNDDDRSQYGVSFGGPLIQDKVFGFGSYEHVDADTSRSYSPVVTSSDTLSEFAGEGFTSSLDRDLLTAKVNFNLGARNTAFVRYSADDNETTNFDLTTTTLEPYNASNSTDSWSLVANVNTAIDSRRVNELTVHLSDHEYSVTPNSPAGSTTFMTAQVFDDFDLEATNMPQQAAQSRMELRDDFTWMMGKHDLQFGVSYVDLEFEDRSLRSPHVTFDYNSEVTLDDLQGAPSLIDYIQLDEVRLDFRFYTPALDYNQIGLYAQDTYRLNDNWTVNFGLRYDVDEGLFDAYTSGEPQDFYQLVASSTEADTPRFENTLPDDPSMLSPRAGFVYRFGGRDRDVLRGSAGIYHDRALNRFALAQNSGPGVSFFSGGRQLQCTFDDGTVLHWECLQGFDVDGPGPIDVLPSDFTPQNWRDESTGLQDWFADVVELNEDGLPLAGNQTALPSPDWEMPFTRSYSLGWSHRINRQWSMDVDAVHSLGRNQPRVWDVRGTPGGAVNTGISPATAAARELYFVTNGRTEYTALLGQVRTDARKYSLIFNLNLSSAEGEQDSGAAVDEAGTGDLFDGGNRRYTGDASTNAFCGSSTPHGNPAIFSAGPSCSTGSDEMGPVSGDQRLWASVAWIYRLPREFTLSGDASLGDNVAIRPYAGFDQNNDGLISNQEYVGSPGEAEGDDFVNLNVRVNKKLRLSQSMSIDLFAEVFNVTDEDNYGAFVTHRQFDVDGSANEAFLDPTGDYLLSPRTFNLGARLHF